MIDLGYNSLLVLISTSLFGACAGLVGTLAVLRRRALVSDALAHGTLPGICLAFLLLYSLGAKEKSLIPLLVGGALTGVGAVGAISLCLTHTRLREDAVIGAVLSFFYGVGVVLLSLIQSEATSGSAGLHHFIYGQAAALRASDGLLIAGCSFFSAVVVLLFFKQFALLCFDQEFTETQLGRRALLDSLLMSLIVIVVMIGLPAVGLVLVVALLTIPSVTARILSDRFRTVTFLAATTGALSCAIGTFISARHPNTPAGGAIVLVATTFFLLALLFSPRRGLLAQGVAHLILRIDARIDHILRHAYELAEKENSLAQLAQFNFSERLLNGNPSYIFLLMKIRQLIKSTASGFRLTDRGVARARVLTRNHRLWEQYLVTYGITPVTHADYSADFVEHSITPEIVRELEAELTASGRSLPSLSSSVHPL